MTELLRGRAIWFDLGQNLGRKPGVIVTNNPSNRALKTCLVARITTTSKEGIPDCVQLGAGDPLTGWVLCRDLVEVYDDEVLDDAGALTRATMTSVGAALAHVFALT